MKYLTRLLQVLFALTFVVSGWAKCVDPAGTAIKLTEYLQYFGFGMLSDFAMGMAWVLCILEFVCGFHLLLGHTRITSLIVSSMLMLFFTPLTLWLALSNAIQDCGCFGDLIHLSNWQTFSKNVVLDIILVWLWYKRNELYQLLGGTAFTLCRYWAFALIVWLCWRGTFREPFIDFRLYKSGTDLLIAIGEEHVAEDSLFVGCNKTAEPTYTCLYRKDGIMHEFPLDSIPDEADGWEFVDTIEHLSDGNDSDASEHKTTLSAAVQSNIDIYFKDVQGNVVTSEILTHPGYTLLLLSPSLDKASQHDIDRIERLHEYAYDQGYPFYCLTANDTLQVNRWLHNTGAEYPFLFTDVTIIQTICRSNPAVMLLHDGIICWKKPLSKVDAERLTSAKLSEQSSGQTEEINTERRILWLFFLLFAPIVLFLLFEIPNYISNKELNKDFKDA